MTAVLVAAIIVGCAILVGDIGARLWDRRRAPKPVLAPPAAGMVSVEALTAMADVLTNALTKTVDQVAKSISEQLRGTLTEVRQVREPAHDERFDLPALDETDPTDAMLPFPFREEAVVLEDGDFEFMGGPV